MVKVNKNMSHSSGICTAAALIYGGSGAEQLEDRHKMSST
jgi:hypothetical protein